MRTFLTLVTLLILVPHFVSSQSCSEMNIQHQADIASTAQQMTMTMQADIQGRPYLYVANKEGGLKIYDISNAGVPQIVQSISDESFQLLHVMNLSQEGNYLYLALGNHFGSATQTAGIAIVDVANPALATVKGVWKDSSTTGGCGIVKVEGDYAYVGAMKRGVVILNISDKNNIRFVSRFVPDINYPTANPNPDLYNARGMEVKNGIVYLCYDAGGFRILNCTDKQHPIETGRYSNPIMNGKARAYNNIVLDDTLVYIAVDYCGLEVLNIRDTANIRLHAWWNPWSCHTNSLNWFSSAGHANEIVYNKPCHKLFIATGKSDMYVVDVTNPAQPDSCNIYGGVDNGLGTWGVSTQGSKIFLSYIVTLGVPFASNWTGVKILSYSPCITSSAENIDSPQKIISLHPNPAEDFITVHCAGTITSIHIGLTNILGKVIEPAYSVVDNNTLLLNTSGLAKGIYLLHAEHNGSIISQRFLKN